MSGESTDHTQNPDDTSSAAPAAPARRADDIVPAFDVPAPEMVDVPDAEDAAADFAVPPPPTFETPAVAPATGVGDVPPPSDATWSAERTWKPRLTWTHDAHGETEAAAAAETVGEVPAAKPVTVQEKIERAARAGRPDPESRASLREGAAAGAERTPVVPPESTEGSYRGWTISIFTGLGVLFIGAIGLMVFLGLSG